MRCPEKRALTTIEEKIINRIMDSISEEIVVAWEPFEEFNDHLPSSTKANRRMSISPLLIRC
jgi:flagellar motor switch protein FliM